MIQSDDKRNRRNGDKNLNSPNWKKRLKAVRKLTDPEPPEIMANKTPNPIS